MTRCKKCQCLPCRCEMFSEQRPPGSAAPSVWGTAAAIHSEAMAVHPDQVPEVMERNRKHGLGHVKYDQHGRPILTDRAMRRDLMRLEGVHDRNGGYGDDHASASPQEPIDVAGGIWDGSETSGE